MCVCAGTYRFFHVQAAFVSEPSMFPPSQKTYGFSTFCIGKKIRDPCISPAWNVPRNSYYRCLLARGCAGALIVATFAAVLATS